ncbi:pyruvate dehydrogenase [acetyl-transferring]-phosphatase 1, mitochondrial [Cloeon dipterum]|uniref:pyruvate dehydrogenase [acetyl-transferring]-phosphatase 1, mitochondrial n=1 Tax=Cloeon dipterum TaxID=197152 RepID=UPI0032202D05
MAARKIMWPFLWQQSSRGYFTSGVLRAYPRLSPQEVTAILRVNEYTQEFQGFSVKSYDSNQLPSNNPIEDTRAEARCLLTQGLLLGIFDGHAGGSCAQVLSKRLFKYVAASLLHPEVVHKYSQAPTDLIQSFNDNYELAKILEELYSSSFKQFLTDLAKQTSEVDANKALERAFLRIDHDMSQEAEPTVAGPASQATLTVATAGAVACVSYIAGAHLHVASTGDCQAVLGSVTENNRWTATKLTEEHNSDNAAEVARILAEHPPNEQDTVIKMDRLLGQLAPLRAFGDFRFKWSRDRLRRLLVPKLGDQALPPNYYTPPYLTAKPQVTHHRLTPKDKFLVIASDGLWDLISPLQAVRLVGEHMSGKVTLNPFRLPKSEMKLKEVNQLLLQRKEGLKMKPLDTNAATHLIRNALGGTEYGVDHGKLSQLLMLPDDMVRVFRDDITVTVVYFDSEFLQKCPA